MSYVDFNKIAELQRESWSFGQPKLRQNPLMKPQPAIPQAKPVQSHPGIISKVLDHIKKNEIRLDWNMYRDFLASKIFGKQPSHDLNAVAQTSMERSDPAVVQSLEKHTPNILEALKAAISKMLSADLSRYTQRRPATAFSDIKVILAYVSEAGAGGMDILTWIKKTIQDNVNNPVPTAHDFIHYVTMVGDHYLRTLAEDEATRAQGLNLQATKDYIKSVIAHHPEVKADMDALQNATEAAFKDNNTGAN
jgi:hypothetical protein